MTIDYIIAALLLSSSLLFAAGRAGVRRAKRRRILNQWKGKYMFRYYGCFRRSSQAGGINKRKFFGG